MKNRLGIIVLILICVALAVGLLWSQKTVTKQNTDFVERVGNYSNKWVVTSADLDKQRQVNAELESDRAKQKEALTTLTNLYTQVSGSLDKTSTSLKETQDEMAKQVAQRDSKISELESQNQALDQRALDLSNSITNLTSQISMTQKKLTASEGDKVFLRKELQRLIAEKAELERQFNDLSVLRTQVAKLKDELNISRRLDWIRRGLFAADNQKGAERLMKMSAQSVKAAKEPPKPAYDLNVEVNSDGTVRVIPPVTNPPPASPVPAP